MYYYVKQQHPHTDRYPQRMPLSVKHAIKVSLHSQHQRY